jgi:hypothetical protein
VKLKMPIPRSSKSGGNLVKVEPKAGAESESTSTVPPQSSTKSARTRARRIRMAQAGAAGPEMVELMDIEVVETTDAPPAAPEPAPESEPTVRDPRLRWALWNSSAAAAGHLVIWSVTGDPMAGADNMGRMTMSVPELAAAALTFGGLVAGWKGAALVHLHKLPGVLGLVARPAAALAAALWGQGTAPVIHDVMYAVEPWGTLLAPLLAAGPVAAACWWGLDRRARQQPPAIRWIARVPLATVTVSSLLYAPGVVL